MYILQPTHFVCFDVSSVNVFSCTLKLFLKVTSLLILSYLDTINTCSLCFVTHIGRIDEDLLRENNNKAHTEQRS